MAITYRIRDINGEKHIVDKAVHESFQRLNALNHKLTVKLADANLAPDSCGCSDTFEVARTITNQKIVLCNQCNSYSYLSNLT